MGTSTISGMSGNEGLFPRRIEIMEIQATSSANAHASESQSSKLSYKFQRLREKLRAAIASGELHGRLPGERQLAKRFHVNAKTLSKALTDLAAEGLLDRSIGRGTFVKSATSTTPANTPADRWLVVCDPDQVSSGIIEHLKRFHENIQVVTEASALRPSFLNPIKAVIDLSSHTSDAFLRDLIVRNITVVLVGREPTTYSVNAVLVDRSLGAACLARDMMLSGHRRFLAVERRGQVCVAEAIRRTAQRYAPESTVDSVYPQDVAAVVEQSGATAVICDTRRAAVQIRESLTRRDIEVPTRVSLAAIGSGWGDYPCSGYFLHSQQKADTIVQLIRETNLKRPTTIWLTGAFVDTGTIARPQLLNIPDMDQPTTTTAIPTGLSLGGPRM
jgi:DNA-binding transcriptional regulator YhcF (GntR family)